MTVPSRPAAARVARVLGAAGRTLVTAGVVVLLFVAYQLWGTNLQEARAQDDLRREFEAALATAATARAESSDEAEAVDSPQVVDAEADTDEAPARSEPGRGDEIDPAVLALFFPEDGDAVARIEIPSIGVDKIVVDGVQVADLRKGPGHYDDTAHVGTEGNTAIAGHRTTYGAPFNRIDELSPGDEIRLTGPLGRFTYRVLDPTEAYPEQLSIVDQTGAGHVVVQPSAVWVLDNFGDNRVTLTACHPKLSARQRIIVAAELIDEPVTIDELGVVVPPEVDTSDDDGEATPTTAVEPPLPGEPGLPGESDLAEGTSLPDGTDGTGRGSDPAGSSLTLDEGLDGERDAIPPALAWLALATAIWVGAGMIGRGLVSVRWGRLAVRVVALLPVGVALWFAFELIDRALPAA